MVTPGRVACFSVSCAMESLKRLWLSAPGEGSGLGAAAAAAAGLGDAYSLPSAAPAPSTCWARVLGSIMGRCAAAKANFELPKRDRPIFSSFGEEKGG